MKIKSIQRVVHIVHYVETEEGDWPEYRRSEGGGWENRMGDSWEECDELELEKAFQEYLAAHRDSAQGILRRSVQGLSHFGVVRLLWEADPTTPAFENDVYHIEFIDADHIRLTRKENP